MLLKPKIQIPTTPFICLYIKYDWEEVKTLEDATNFVHKWIEMYHESKNEVKKNAIKQWIFPIYSILTNKSYESNITI